MQIQNNNNSENETLIKILRFVRYNLKLQLALRISKLAVYLLIPSALSPIMPAVFISYNLYIVFNRYKNQSQEKKQSLENKKNEFQDNNFFSDINIDNAIDIIKISVFLSLKSIAVACIANMFALGLIKSIAAMLISTTIAIALFLFYFYDKDINKIFENKSNIGLILFKDIFLKYAFDLMIIKLFSDFVFYCKKLLNINVAPLFFVLSTYICFNNIDKKYNFDLNQNFLFYDLVGCAFFDSLNAKCDSIFTTQIFTSQLALLILASMYICSKIVLENNLTKNLTFQLK